MNRSKEVAFFGLILAALMASLLMPVNGSGVEFNAQARTLQFLSDVVMLDLSKYNVTLRSDKFYDVSDLGGTQREDVRYTIQTSDSYLDAMVDYLNGTYSFCGLDWRKGSPIYRQPQPTNPVDFAKAVLERFQVFIGSPRYQPLSGMLDVISQTGQTTAVSGNFRLTETVNSANVGFQWLYSVSGFETNAMTITIHNGALYSITDAMSIFKVSDAPTVVSEQQAVSIALNSIVGFSWRASDGEEYNVTDPLPTDFFRTQQILNTRPPRDPSTLYPLWKVTLALGKTYPGGVNHIIVGVWADTGEVSYIQAVGTGGVPSEGTTNSPSQPSGSSEGPADSSSQSSGSSSGSSMPGSASSPSSTGPTDSTTSPDTTPPPDSTPPPSQQPTNTSTPTLNPTTITATTATIAAIVTAATALLIKKKRR